MSDFPMIGFDEDWAERLQSDVSKMLERLHALADGELSEYELQPLSGEPFCGCDICVEREVWWMVIGRTLQGHRDGSVWLAEDDPVTVIPPRMGW